MTDARDALREQLAALAHAQWTGWMTYAFSRCVRVPSDGCLIIPAEWMERWQRQMDTAYADLPEHEKESDRAEADRVLALLPQGERSGALSAALVAEYAALLARSRRDPNRLPDAEKEWYVRGARDALLHVAERLGVLTLHDQAADVVARDGQEQP